MNSLNSLTADYFGLAYQFFNLTRESISEMEKQGNQSMIFSDANEYSDLDWSQYEEKTRWNDFNVGVPILYNFYHGLELYMKGLFYRVNESKLSTNHDLTSLLAKLEEHDDIIPQSILDILRRNLTEQSSFHDFFKANGGNVDNYYVLLRYPESKSKKQFTFSMIRGNEQIGLSKFKEIQSDTIRLRSEIISWYESMNTPK